MSTFRCCRTLLVAPRVLKARSPHTERTDSQLSNIKLFCCTLCDVLVLKNEFEKTTFLLIFFSSSPKLQ
jgi:hypothetical protein